MQLLYHSCRRFDTDRLMAKPELRETEAPRIASLVMAQLRPKSSSQIGHLNLFFLDRAYVLR